MATVKISSLPSITSLNSADALPTVDIGSNPASPTTYKVTVQSLANSLTRVTSSISASFSTTASFASNVSGNIFTSTNPALSASYALTASYVASAVASFPFSGSAVITGSLVVSGSTGIEFTVIGDSTITGSVIISGSSPIELFVIGGTQFTGSVASRGGFTGSLFGTASFATGSIFVDGNLALSASYALTSSYLNDLNQNLTITGSLIISGSPNPEIRVIGDMTVTGSLIVSGNNGAGIFSQGATFVDYVSTITTNGSYMVWRAPFSCSVVGLYGYYTGGTSPQINAARSGSSGYGRITGSNVLLNIDGAWIAATGSGLQNKDFNVGDSLQVIMSGSSNYQLAVQVDFIRKF